MGGGSVSEDRRLALVKVGKALVIKYDADHERGKFVAVGKKRQKVMRSATATLVAERLRPIHIMTRRVRILVVLSAKTLTATIVIVLRKKSA